MLHYKEEEEKKNDDDENIAKQVNDMQMQTQWNWWNAFVDTI